MLSFSPDSHPVVLEELISTGGSPPGGILCPGEHAVLSGNILDCYDGGGARGMEWVSPRDAAQHPVSTGGPPPPVETPPAPNVQGASLGSDDSEAGTETDTLFSLMLPHCLQPVLAVAEISAP